MEALSIWEKKRMKGITAKEAKAQQVAKELSDLMDVS
jgi:hypothetical protein